MTGNRDARLCAQWFREDAERKRHQAEHDYPARIAELTRRLELFAELARYDLDTIDVLATPAFQRGYDTTPLAYEIRADLDELETYVDRGEPCPPAVDNRGRTLRRWLQIEHERRVTT